MNTVPTTPPSLDDSMGVVWQQFIWPALVGFVLMFLILGLWCGTCYLIGRAHRKSKVNRQWEDIINPRI
jgi:glycerol uptake facilitator-like aquaporin